jgi:hypothetical protein
LSSNGQVGVISERVEYFIPIAVVGTSDPVLPKSTHIRLEEVVMENGI